MLHPYKPSCTNQWFGHIWNTGTLSGDPVGDAKSAEAVQRRATKLIIELIGQPYISYLKALNLLPLVYRQVTWDKGNLFFPLSKHKVTTRSSLLICIKSYLENHARKMLLVSQPNFDLQTNIVWLTKICHWLTKEAILLTQWDKNKVNHSTIHS